MSGGVLFKAHGLGNDYLVLESGEPIDAATALAGGLISEGVAPHELRARAEALATRIAANAPLALAAIKRTVIDSHEGTSRPMSRRAPRTAPNPKPASASTRAWITASRGLTRASERPAICAMTPTIAA